MASVREALGRFNIVPSLDFENEALVDIPVMSRSNFIPSQPRIEINTNYNPFESDSQVPDRSSYIDQFEKENTKNWEKLYTTLEKENENTETFDSIRETQRRFFQLKNKYIVCPVKSGLMLIDQKRAHERILFERFMECLSNNRAVSQTDMFPVKAELNPSDYLLLKEIEEELRILGYSFTHPGNNVVIISGRPAESDPSNPVETLEILLEAYKNTQSDPSKDAMEKVASGMATASAIQYGKALTHGEMEELFDTLFSCKSPNYSAKGKPVINILTMEELEKRFK